MKISNAYTGALVMHKRTGQRGTITGLMSGRRVSVLFDDAVYSGANKQTTLPVSQLWRDTSRGTPIIKFSRKGDAVEIRNDGAPPVLVVLKTEAAKLLLSGDTLTLLPPRPTP